MQPWKYVSTNPTIIYCHTYNQLKKPKKNLLFLQLGATATKKFDSSLNNTYFKIFQLSALDPHSESKKKKSELPSWVQQVGEHQSIDQSQR